MNPNYSDEMKDRNLREYLEECQNAHRDLSDQIDELRAVSMDFSEGSQQRFMIALREAQRAYDHVWYLEQKRDDHE